MPKVFAEFETIYNRLKEKSKSDLRKSVVVAFPGDPALPTLFEKLSTTEQELAALSPDLGTGHPRIKQLVELLDKLNQQLDGRIDGLMQGLEVKVAAAKDRASILTKAVEDAKKKDAAMNQRFQPYFKAKRDHELQLQYLNVLKGRIVTETADAALPLSRRYPVLDSVVIAHLIDSAKLSKAEVQQLRRLLQEKEK